ncbi:hypothetical protein Zmor_013466 [Zophobas morio]|uniref:Uncharacterized protein n=1 Tax=Zophobas morio TaxID=2755281 RepID=A0AA38IAM6_9CUCU|nr:hypothetical protein Zmor_013466 [Zophobas morio]
MEAPRYGLSLLILAFFLNIARTNQGWYQIMKYVVTKNTRSTVDVTCAPRSSFFIDINVSGFVIGEDTIFVSDTKAPVDRHYRKVGFGNYGERRLKNSLSTLNCGWTQFL